LKARRLKARVEGTQVEAAPEVVEGTHTQVEGTQVEAAPEVVEGTQVEGTQVEAAPKSTRQIMARAEAEGVDPDVAILEAEEAKTPKQKVKDATPEDAEQRVLDYIADTAKINEADLDPKYFKKGAKLSDSLDQLAASIAQEEVGAKETYRWVRENLSPSSKKYLGEQVRAMRGALGLPIPTGAVAKTSRPITPEVRAMLESGDIKGAVASLTALGDPTITKIANAVSNNLGNTKVVVSSGVVNERGEPVAGLYNPQTDTITLNGDVDLTNHVLLHESIHAVTSHELAKNTPAARQMRNLFEAVRDRLDGAYGTTNLDEFVAEAFSNPEFQAKLGRINEKGEPISIWSKFKNIIGNIFRRLRGLEARRIDSAMDAADSIIADLISPAPDYRDAVDLYSSVLENKEESTLNTLGRWSKGKVTAGDVGAAIGFMEERGRRSRRLMLDVLPLNAIAEIIKKDFPELETSATELFKKVQEKRGEREDLLTQLNDTVVALTNNFKGRPEARKLFDELVAESTLVRVDPFNPRSKYFNDEFKRDDWDRLQEDYVNKMPERDRKAYKKLRDSYTRIYDDLVRIVEQRIDTLPNTGLRQKLRDKLLNDLLNRNRIEPYFPLYRKGTHWLEYRAFNTRTNTTELFKEAFESAAQRGRAAAMLEELAASQPELRIAGIQTYDRSADRKQRYGGVDTRFAYDLLGDLRQAGLPPQFEDIIIDTMFDAMPERGMLQAFRGRKDVLGFEIDAIKTLQKRMPAFINQTLNLKYDLPISEIRKKIETDTAKYVGKPKQGYAEDVRDNLLGYADFAKNPQIATWAKMLKSAGFGMTLGLNVSSVIVNYTNLPIVVVPYLGGKYNYPDTVKAVGRAKKIYFRSGTKRRRKDLTGAEGELSTDGPSLTHIDWDADDLSPDLVRYKPLAELLKIRGQANASTTADILELNAENTLWTKVNSVMGYMFHQGERLNRQVTAIASYDLELNKRAKKGELTEQDYKDAAELALETTELTNSGAMLETGPRLSQNNWGSWMLMYKRFGISMYYLQFKMAKEALRDADPDVRRQAKRQIAGIFASSALFAGVQGLPLYGALSFMWDLIFTDDDDENFDSLAAGFFNEGMYSGAVNAAFGVEVAGRVGMSNLIYRSQPNREQESLILQALETAGGPILGIASRMEDGFGLISEGQVYRGVERVLPSSISNGMRGWRYATEGATTLRGDPIVEDINAWNVFAQSIGLAPAGYTRQLEINARDKRIDLNIATERGRLLRRYNTARIEGDVDELMEIQQDMNEFSQRNPEVGIDGDTIERSIRSFDRTSEMIRQLKGITVNPNRLMKVLREREEDLRE
jgi:hypothetical protein